MIKDLITINELITCDYPISNLSLMETAVKFINNIDLDCDIKETTRETYKKALRVFFHYLNENNIKKPSKEDIKEFRQSLYESGLKANTIRLYIFSLHRFFTWTKDNGVYPDIVGNIKGAKVDNTQKKDNLTSAQAKRLLNGVDRTTLKGKRDYAMLCLMTTCGLRDIEITRLNIEDIKTLGNNKIAMIHGKGRDDKSDYVIIPDAVDIAINEYLNERKEKDKSKPLFNSLTSNAKQDILTPRSVSRIVKNYLIKVGLNSDRLSAHSLRHTTCTLALESGLSIQEVKEMMRHASIDTTLRYAHNYDKQNSKGTKIVSDMLFSN